MSSGVPRRRVGLASARRAWIVGRHLGRGRLGEDEARSDGVGADAVAAVAHGQVARQLVQGRLGDAVGHPGRLADGARPRRDGDDGAPAACRHDRDGVARQEEGAARRDLERPLPDAEVDPDGVGVEAGVAPGGVVVDRVDAPELGDGALDEARRRTPRGARRSAGRQRAPAGGLDLLGHRDGALGRHVADDHRRPSAASRNAVARPMSEAPPLTRTTLPSSCPPSGVMEPS